MTRRPSAAPRRADSYGGRGSGFGAARHRGRAGSRRGDGVPGPTHWIDLTSAQDSGHRLIHRKL